MNTNNANEYKQAAEYLRSYVKNIEFEIPTDSNDIKKELDYFQKTYAPEVLETLDDASVLSSIFYTVGDNTKSLCYYLEMNKECRSHFGSIAGGSAHKFGLFQKKEIGEWITGSPLKPQILSEHEALELGKNIRDALVAGAKVIRDKEVADLASYESLDSDLKKILGEQMYNWSWVHKYYSLICNDKLSGFHSKEWQCFVLQALHIKPSEGYYTRSGQISMIQNHCRWYYRELFDVIKQRFGSPRQFVRIGTVTNEKNYAAEWREEGIVGIGWPGLGDLSAYEEKNGIPKGVIQSRLKELYYSENENTASRKAGEIIRFYKADKGTVFVVMNGEKLIALAEGEGDYYFDPSSDMSHRQHAVWKYEFEEDERLPEKNEGKQTTCYPIKNEDNLLFLYDRFYYGSDKGSSQKLISTSEESGYWPSLSEYDPGITAQEYHDLFTSEKIVRRPWLEALYELYMMPGHLGTCYQLGKRYGYASSHYVSYLTSAATNIAKETNAFPPEEENARYWPVLFQEKYTVDKSQGDYCWRMREPVIEAIEMLIDEGVFKKKEGGEMAQFDHNTILYGPPGTGKTYNSVIYAVAMCDGRPVEDVKQEAYSDILTRYNELKDAGRIVFTTFHQSYGYEEFIEGIRPVMADDEGTGDLQYVITDGIFKKLCKEARTPEASEIDHNAAIWFIWLKDKGSSDLKKECFRDNEIRFEGPETPDKDFDWTYKRLMKMKPGDFILTYYSSSTVIDGVGVIQDSDLTYDHSKSSYNWTRKVKWLIAGKQIDVKAINSNKYLPNFSLAAMNHMNLSDLLRIVEENSGIEFGSNDKPYVMIIDEINRGNISKIFGELITLIEDKKRAGAGEAMEAVLPYSGEAFSVPNNVYILGTMNTADRSIALMDTALRRRFDFVEMMPEPEVLRSLGIGTIEVDGEKLDIAGMLEVMNRRIEYLYDREHTLGHAFFMKLKKNNSLKTLAEIFEKNIIPLLQEYFYEDYEKIQLVLGDNAKKDEYKFILDKPLDSQKVFRGSTEIDLPEKGYSIQQKAFKKIESYRQIVGD